MAAQRRSERPLLVLTGTAAGNPFSRYVLEILDVEGFAGRDVRDLEQAELRASDLAAYDVALLANADLTAAQQAALSEYVERGGNLVALRVSDQQLERTMALVSREDRALAPAARALRDFLERELVRQ